MAEETVFRLEDVYFSYLGRYPALCGISLDIKRGEKISVIGANGCGKSSLLHILDGLIFPDSGKISLCSKELKEDAFEDMAFSSDFRKKVGFVFQNSEVQLFCPTVKEDIVFGPLQMGKVKTEIKRRLDELAFVLNIEELLERSPHQLSIGEKRKVAIASVLIIDPEVIIMDEPTAGLDPLTTRHIIDLLTEASRSGKTIITATHDLHIVEEISDTVYVVSREKKIVGSGSPERILADTQLLKENNLVHIHSHKHRDATHAHPHLHIDHHH
ncbi:MAG: ABC transporter ATP-binding protein [Candidatus Omnitrophica bacterium]|nr:ABC transporter ATP-binding protein [Candidatus Omnitrophota bacterium]